MKQTFRLSMSWLHTWCGLLLGWLLFAIFVTGTASYYKPEISAWMRPELAGPSGKPADALPLIARAVDEIESLSPDASTIYIVLPDDRHKGLLLNWDDSTGRHTRTVDAAAPAIRERGTRTASPEARETRTALPQARETRTALPEARETRGGEFFYRFHFQLQLPYPWGRWIACFAAVFMLVALVTGVIAHRRFFKDFFTFRPGRGGRAWLDFHNLAGIVTLPFALMIAYTALIMLLGMYMPWGKLATEPKSKTETAAATTQTAPEDSLPQSLPPPEPEPEKISSYSFKPHLPAMLDEVARQWNGDTPRFLYAADLGTPSARIGFGPGAAATVSTAGREWIYFSAVTGRLPPGAAEPTPRGFVSRLHDVLYGLHLARFAGPPLRALFFLLGVLGTAMTATGLVLWTVRRRGKHEKRGRVPFGHGLVERLNIAVIAGFPLALATFFWANRLLPVDLASRGDREVNVVFVVWGLAALHALLRPVFRAWSEQLWAAAFLYAALPFLDVVTTEGFGGRLAFNLSLLGLGGLWAWAALRIDRRGSGFRNESASNEKSSLEIPS